jgi:putative transposase
MARREPGNRMPALTDGVEIVPAGIVYEPRSLQPLKRGERGIWHCRYWEHLIRDERDFQAHRDHVHANALKHGLVARVADWPYLPFHRLAEQRVYPLDYCGENALEATGHGD